MQIQSLATATDPTQQGSAATVPAASSASTSDPTQAAGGSSSSLDALANESTFLQLLVAQIKNQDPLNPTDSMQFLTQLAQFSQLEQLIGIRSELSPQTPAATTTTPPTTTSPTN